MTTVEPRWDLSEIELSESATKAALRVVAWTTQDKDDITAQWRGVIRLAHRNGASLRDIAKAAGVSPQTVANIVND